MIRYAWMALSGLLLTLTACSQKSLRISGMPDCLSTRISRLATESACKDPSVTEYQFQEKTVYVLSNGTCGADMADAVVDANCKPLGNLGGITGNQKINDEAFSNARFIRIVWKAR